MSKQKLLFSALATALLCLGQQTSPQVTPPGTFTDYVAGDSIYSGSAFSPNLNYGLYIRDNQVWRLEFSTGKDTPVVNPAKQPYSYTSENQISDTGVALLYGGSPKGSQIYQVDLDGTITPVLFPGQVLPQGTVTFPSGVVIARDGDRAVLQGILDNKFTVFLYSLIDRSIAVLNSVNQPPLFIPGTTESNLIWGFIEDASNNYSALATMDFTGKLTPVSTFPIVNGVTYSSATGQAASSRHGVLFTAFRNIGSDTVTDLLWYSADTKESSVLVNGQDIAPLVITGPLSMNYNAEAVFNVASLSSIWSAAYRISPMDSNPIPEMIVGSGSPISPVDGNVIAQWPAISEDGKIAVTYGAHIEQGQAPSEGSIEVFTPSTPYIFPGGVVRSADGAPEATSLDWISIYGHGFNCLDESTYKNNQFEVIGCLGQPDSFPAEVFANGIPCPLWFVSPGQINCQLPQEAGTGTVPVQVVVGSQQSNTQTISVVSVAPAFFLQSNGAAIATHQNGTLITETSPASVGEFINFWGCGFGPTTVTPADGQGYSGTVLDPTLNSVTMVIGGTTTKNVVAFGAPTLVGLYQIQLQGVPMPNPPPLPADKANGVITLTGTLQVAGQKPIDLTLPVQIGIPPPPPPQ